MKLLADIHERNVWQRPHSPATVFEGEVALERGTRVGGRKISGPDVGEPQPGRGQGLHEQVMDVGPLVERHRPAAQVGQGLDGGGFRHQDCLAGRGGRLEPDMQQRRAGRRYDTADDTMAAACKLWKGI